MFAKIAYADTLTAQTLLSKIADLIINPVIILLFAIALCIFLYGVFEFLRKVDDTKAREAGKNHMIWGVVGLFIMMAAYAIINIVVGTLGDPTPAREAISNTRK